MAKYIFAKDVLLITLKKNYFKNIEHCSNNEAVSVKMPPRNSKLCFNNYQKQLPVPFVVYADFECFTKPINTCSPNPEESYNYNYQKHEPSGFCLYIKGIVPNIIEAIIYKKRKVLITFLKYLFLNLQK